MTKTVGELEVGVDEVVDYLKFTGTYTISLQEVVARKLTAEAAKKSGISVSNNEIQKAVDNFRAVNGLHKAKDTDRWLSSVGLSIETLASLLETNLIISKFKDNLENKARKNKYYANPGIKDSVREMIYQDWLSRELI